MATQLHSNARPSAIGADILDRPPVQVSSTFKEVGVCLKHGMGSRYMAVQVYGCSPRRCTCGIPG